MKEIKAFKTKDGFIYENYQESLRHETLQEFISWYDMNDIHREVGAEYFLEFLKDIPNSLKKFIREAYLDGRLY